MVGIIAYMVTEAAGAMTSTVDYKPPTNHEHNAQNELDDDAGLDLTARDVSKPAQHGTDVYNTLATYKGQSLNLLSSGFGPGTRFRTVAT